MIAMPIWHSMVTPRLLENSQGATKSASAKLPQMIQRARDEEVRSAVTSSPFTRTQ